MTTTCTLFSCLAYKWRPTMGETNGGERSPRCTLYLHAALCAGRARRSGPSAHPVSQRFFFLPRSFLFFFSNCATEASERKRRSILFARAACVLCRVRVGAGLTAFLRARSPLSRGHKTYERKPNPRKRAAAPRAPGAGMGFHACLCGRHGG